MELKVKAKLIQNEDMDAVYIILPYNIKELYGKGRLLVDTTFNDVEYQGQMVKMGTPDYIIGVTKAIREKIDKTFGDEIEVTIKERDCP